MGEALVADAARVEPEPALVRDMLKRAAFGAPVLIIVFGLVWGVSGALSTAFAIGLVLVNFVIAAALVTWAGRISVAALGAAALFGFLLRLGLIFVAVLLVRDQWWVSLVPLGITIIVTHLGLLFWEMRYVSATLAFPGLKPSAGSSAGGFPPSPSFPSSPSPASLSSPASPNSKESTAP